MTDVEFPRSVRLLNAGEFQRVFDAASCKTSNASFVLLARTTTSGNARIGFVIGKKNIRKAVQRNRIRRVIRESFRHQRVKLPLLDIVVLVKKGADQFDNAQIFRQFDHLWQKLTQRSQAAASQT